MLTKEDIGRGYDRIAEKIYVSDDFYNEVLDIEQNFKGDILEAGVGQGVVLANILRRGGNHKQSLTGIDLSDRLIAMARQRLPQANIFKADVEAMPFSDASFDFVIMVDTFQYLQNFGKALEEIKRVLRPEGKFIVTVPNKRWILFKSYIAHRKNTQPVDDHFFDFDEMKNLLERHGFKILNYQGADALRFYGKRHQWERLIAHIFFFLHKRMKKIVFRCQK